MSVVVIHHRQQVLRLPVMALLLTSYLSVAKAADIFLMSSVLTRTKGSVLRKE